MGHRASAAAGIVHVDATQTRRIEHRLGEDEAISHDDHQIGTQSGQFGLRRFIAQEAG